jgi:hypothetical protein
LLLSTDHVAPDAQANAISNAETDCRSDFVIKFSSHTYTVNLTFWSANSNRFAHITTDNIITNTRAFDTPAHSFPNAIPAR